MIALTVSLGRWQSGRAEEKAERQAAFEARIADAPLELHGSSGPAEALLYRRVRIAGRWDAQGQIFVDNQIHNGRAGFHVITPLRMDGSTRIALVNRGWTARTPAYPAAPQVSVPVGRVVVTGLATLPPKRYLELSGETISGNVWQNLSLERYAQRCSVALLPVMVLADRAGDGLAAVEEKPDAGIAKHREYALTWYSLALTLLALWLYYSFRRSDS
jgi:surfeit locus 1 family protein